MNDIKASKYLKLAQFQADEFSKDSSRKVGCILLAPNSLQVLSTGYNGPPRGVDDNVPERWVRPAKYMWVEHAERNSIYSAARHGTPLEGAIAVCTLFPCTDCARALIQAGIKCLITTDPSENANHSYFCEGIRPTLTMLKEAGVELVLFDTTFESRVARA
jgi:dCMP deaminase